MNDYEKNFWITFLNIHQKTKNIYIKAEEYDTEFCSIIQPIKEQRDALDHIVRAYTEIITDDTKEKDEKYIKKNFEKAIGHIYRSFFDTADILTIILREHINKELSQHSYKMILKYWDNYEEIRKRLISINEDIATLRINKEIKKKQEEQEALFNEYDKILDFLFKTFEYVFFELYPKINV